MHKDLFPVMLKELDKFKQARSRRDYAKCEVHLGRAHILSQKSVIAHLGVHWVMLIYAYGKKDYKELRGQILRFLVVIPGHLFGRVPKGNTGWSSIRLTQELPIPNDLNKYLE